MNNTDDELDKLVDELYRHFLTDSVGYEGKYEKHTSKAKQAIKDLLDKVIGEDEDVSQWVLASEPCVDCGCPMEEVTRNKLRQTQRQALSKEESRYVRE